MNEYYKNSLVRATLALGICTSIGTMSAQQEASSFVPFHEFLARTKAVSSPSVLAAKSASAAKILAVDQTSFNRMRQHILDTYQGVRVDHSYMLGEQTFDCIPVEQQPALRHHANTKIAATPPDLPEPAHDAAAQTRLVGDAVPESVKPQTSGEDAFGNTVGCEVGNIPMRRITLEEMTHFGSVEEFFSKGPNGAGRAMKSRLASENSAEAVPGVDLHKHAIAYQTVNNIGGKSLLNIWSPYVYTSISEDFSLSQQWFVGYGGGTVQTVESGIQNYPAKYGSQNGVLFIYATRDNYRTPNAGEATVGCYNLDCGIFVQVSNSYALGAKFGSYSVGGGAQYEIPIQWQLSGGNWWMNVNGTWVGYYPGSFFRGGQLTRYATDIEFGGETASDPYYGNYYYAGMGSGMFASSGWTHAAYQRGVWYIDTASVSRWSSMKATTEAAACFTVSGPYYEASTWGSYFYFGGPGGFCK